MRIDSCLQTLKERLEKNELIELQLEKGNLSYATCSFNPPAVTEEVEAFMKSHNWHIPPDYKYFLTQHNGSLLFTHPKYGGGFDLFSLSSIPKIVEEYGYMFPDTCMPIGMMNSALIYIDSNKAKEGENNLFWQSCMLPNESAINLNMSFEVFLDLLIVAQGSEFWLWPTFKAV